jgi:hypothetical protein
MCIENKNKNENKCDILLSATTFFIWARIKEEQQIGKMNMYC